MTEISPLRPLPLLRRIDKALLVSALIVLAVAVLTPDNLLATVSFALTALLHTAPFILFAVAAVAFLKATGAETLLSQAFTGHTGRMILFGALLGGLSPFCSCEVIPFIAALLSMGVPLAGVMAFWLSSPLMDPAMFAITAGELGTSFAVAKTIGAVGMGVFGGTLTWALSRTTLLVEPLRATATPGCGCGTAKPFSGAPVWRFWTHADRRTAFRDVAAEQTFFLGKWLLLAYLLEALMVAHVPASWIAHALGGDGTGTVILAAILGAPAYLNGYVAAGLMGSLVDQGMSTGAAMAFMIAGGVTSIPAAVAVAALVKPRVTGIYLLLGLTVAIVAGLVLGPIA